jgi:hypothetical protein
VRKTAYSEQLNKQMAQTTHTWLAMHHFPDADHVLFYSNPQDKLYQIIEQTVKNSYHLILIDGRYEALQADLSSLNSLLAQRIQCSLTLCAFGVVEIAHEITHSAIFETVAFSAWEDIDAFIQAWISMIEKRYVSASPHLKSRR